MPALSWGRMKPPMGSKVAPWAQDEQRILMAWLLNEGGGALGFDAADRLLPGALNSGTFVDGDAGGGVAFGGTSGNRLVAPISSLGNVSTSPFTMIVRVKPVTTSGTQGYMALRVFDGGVDTGADAISLNIRSGGSFQAEGYGAGGAPNLSSGVTPTALKWYTLAYTWDGTTSRIYVDGLEKGSNASAPQPFTPIYVVIGGFGFDFDQSTAVYDYALLAARAWTQQEILRDHTEPYWWVQKPPAVRAVTAPAAPPLTNTEPGPRIDLPHHLVGPMALRQGWRPTPIQDSTRAPSTDTEPGSRVRVPNPFVGPPALRQRWRPQPVPDLTQAPATDQQFGLRIRVPHRWVGPPVLRRLAAQRGLSYDTSTAAPVTGNRIRRVICSSA